MDNEAGETAFTFAFAALSSGEGRGESGETSARFYPLRIVIFPEMSFALLVLSASSIALILVKVVY